MGSNKKSNTSKPGIPCVEVLVSRSSLTNTNNLLWTLSVYSLENRPVKKLRELHNSEIFHFMVFDWKRTVKQLLERNKVSYSVIQFFTTDSINADAHHEPIATPDDESAFLEAINKLPPEPDTETAERSREVEQDAGLIH